MKTKNLILGVFIVLLVMAGSVTAFCKYEDWISTDDCKVCIDSAASQDKLRDSCGEYTSAVRCYVSLGDEQKKKDALNLCVEKCTAWGGGPGYGLAADCYKSVGDYRNALEYDTKAFDIEVKANSIRDVLGSCAMIVAEDYGALGDKANACDWCKKANEYLRKERKKELDCTAFGCNSESSGSGTIGSTSSGDKSGGLPILPIAIGGLILLVVAALFLLKKK